MFPKKSDWTLLYCWNGKQSMWELCDCIELTLILATGIKVDRTQYRHTHTKVELQRIHGIVSHLIFLYISVFFWRRKSGRTMGMPKSRLNAEQSKIRLLLVSSLWLCLLVQSIELIHIFLSGADHFQSFFLSFYSRDVPWICFEIFPKKVNERESIFNWEPDRKRMAIWRTLSWKWSTNWTKANERRANKCAFHRFKFGRFISWMNRTMHTAQNVSEMLERNMILVFP